MDSQHRLNLATRIHLGLMRELGQGIDVKQMLGSALYARDVLLVCQAFPGSDLQRLGEQFRQASADLIARRAAPARRLAARPQRLRRLAGRRCRNRLPSSTTSPIRCPTRASRRAAG